jgi:two-component system LytT family sensor kinase
VLWVFLASSLAGVVMSLRALPGDQTWGQVVRWSLAFAYAWGALTFLIVAIDRQVVRSGQAPVIGLLWHLPSSLIVSALSAYVVPAFSVLLSVPGSRLTLTLSLEPLRQAQRWGLASQTILYWAILGACRAVHYYARYQERAVRAVELEKLLVQSQLQALRMQLEPHFLFNALNTISAHVESDPRGARRMIEELGELLRCSLESHDHQEVPLSHELVLLNHYLAIQRARFEDRLRIDLDIPPGTLDARVPSQLLQPLVENALRHGLAPRASGGSVRIEAARDGMDLRIRVVDDGIGLAGGEVANGVAGRGLSITRQRLACLYPGGSAHLDIRNGPESGVVVEIVIPWRTDSAERPRNSHGENASTRPLSTGR